MELKIKIATPTPTFSGLGILLIYYGFKCLSTQPLAVKPNGIGVVESVCFLELDPPREGLGLVLAGTAQGLAGAPQFPTAPLELLTATHLQGREPSSDLDLHRANALLRDCRKNLNHFPER